MTNQKGFTLVELLVAIGITGLIGILSLSGLNTSLSINKKTLDRSDLISGLQLTDRVLKRDLLHALRRNPRLYEGARQNHPLYGEVLLSEEVFLAFSIHSSIDYQDQGGSIRWIEYSKSDNRIIRNEYFFADRTEETEVLSTVLLNNIESVELSFINQGQSYLSWPSQYPEGVDDLPQIIEVTLKIKSYGDVSMSYLLTEGFQV
jgi:general secretion pathway protein J